MELPRCAISLSKMLEKIVDRRNIEKALVAVERNRGAAGIDNLQSDELRQFLYTYYQSLCQQILEGTYKPKPVRKVEIPKPHGGVRMLGIPTVTDRMLQQAIHQVLSPVYEEQFDKNSFGFRPGKNAHQAVLAAKEYINAGYEWIIELDLEKFFDKVNHRKLMGLISKTVKDTRTLKLINAYLRSGIMEDGAVSQRIEGTPQGSPLSPLLSNIMLHELDGELNRRGHKFVRYADDCSIYVRSGKTAKRVAESIIRYIEKKLLLKVNREKTRVSRPSESQLLGFSFYRAKEKHEIRISAKSLKLIKGKCKRITKSSDPTPQKAKLKELGAVIRGWVNYFKIAKAKSNMQRLDELIRTRLRIAAWRRWKLVKTKVRNLISLGIAKSRAYMWGNSSKGACRIAHSPILCRTLDIKYWQKAGYIGFYNYYIWQTDGQPSLF
ncbi:MAG: group II intron reverse transcriptase/maturase [Chitinophagaceae bacterium]